MARLLQLEEQHHDERDEGTEERNGRAEGRRRLVVAHLVSIVGEAISGRDALELEFELERVELTIVALGGTNVGVIEHCNIALSSGNDEGRRLVVVVQIGIDGIVIGVLRIGHGCIPSVSVEIGLVEQIEVHVVAVRVVEVLDSSRRGVRAEGSPLVITRAVDEINTLAKGARIGVGQRRARLATGGIERADGTRASLGGVLTAVEGALCLGRPRGHAAV